MLVLVLVVTLTVVVALIGARADARRHPLHEARARTALLADHRLRLVDDGGRGWIDAAAFGPARGLIARTVDGAIEVRAPVRERGNGLRALCSSFFAVRGIDA